MKRRPGVFLLSLVQLDEGKSEPLYKQLYESLRQAILSGQLHTRVRLPSIRDLSTLLNISRNTVTHALDQLTAEGYLETKPGAGTFVTHQLPDDLLKVPFDPTQLPKPAAVARRYSQRSSLITNLPQTWVISSQKGPAFRYGLPALDHFPRHIWARLTARRYRYGPTKYFDFTLMSAGHQPLREATAEYLRSSRGVKCHADQVLIVSGAQQGIFIAAHVLLDPGDRVLIEEPGFQSAHRAFINAGAIVVPVPIDHKGFNLNQGLKSAVEARVAFVTPSRQHPTGRTMTLDRRLELIDWARRVDGWIIEDDYDSEFNYTKRPLAALQGLDIDGRVIYIGTFSKVLFPALRLGYMVVPKDLIDKFTNLRGIIDTYTPTISQVILADFMEQGHFTRHLRRMRQLYADRMAVFMREAKQIFADLLEFESTHAGMSVAAWLPNSVSDLAVHQLAAQKGITVAPISLCYFAQPERQGLLFGYAACDETMTKEGLFQVKTALETALSVNKVPIPIQRK